jgi:Cdc6-like AAA superfamily ATPase
MSQILSLTDPETLPGRETEINRIYQSLMASIKSNKGLTMHIAGSAGSGKTSCVSYVIKMLKNDLHDKFCTVYINALKLKDRKDAYHLVWNVMKANLQSSQLRKSEKFETTPQRIAYHFQNSHLYCIITVDEIDFLKGRDQTELYEFFNWPQTGSCAVVGISNNVSLTDSLTPKISSRLESTERIIFLTYNQKQILAILKERVKGSSKFEDSSLEYASRKIASVSGDIRKGLTIVQKAVQIHQERSKIRTRIKDPSKRQKTENLVTVEDMHEAFTILEKEESWPLEKLGLIERIFLICIQKSSLATGDKDGYTSFDNVIQRVQTQLQQIDERYHVMTLSLLKPYVDTLVGMHLVGLQKSFNDIYPHIRLLIGPEMIEKLEKLKV